MGFIEFHQVSKQYGSVIAADQIDLTIEEGEFFSLLGPSGCGKTTVLRLIAGFIHPDQGSILVGGQRVETVPPEKRNVGMVFQNYALFPHLTVAGNIAFGLSVKHVSKDEIQGRVAEMLDLVRLKGLGDRFPRQLSGGQQQRVALARALITRPSVLLLDEPLAALDKQLRSQMQVELRELQRELGITTFFVTHDQEEAMTLSDRIAVMKEGQIIQIGYPSEVYERPLTKFISNFLGSSNFFEGSLESCEKGLARVQVRPELVFTAGCDVPLSVGQPLTLAVRPEKVRLFSRVPDLPNVIPAKVEHLVYMGTSTTYLLQPEQGERITVFAQNEGSTPDFELGERVYAAWEPDSCFLLQE
jgi:spermidine/putrescine ABC transporter ATP-binding subunit